MNAEELEPGTLLQSRVDLFQRKLCHGLLTFAMPARLVDVWSERHVERARLVAAGWIPGAAVILNDLGRGKPGAPDDLRYDVRALVPSTWAEYVSHKSTTSHMAPPCDGHRFTVLTEGALLSRGTLLSYYRPVPWSIREFEPILNTAHNTHDTALASIVQPVGSAVVRLEAGMLVSANDPHDHATLASVPIAVRAHLDCAHGFVVHAIDGTRARLLGQCLDDAPFCFDVAMLDAHRWKLQRAFVSADMLG